jgi:hypothetical protein
MSGPPVAGTGRWLAALAAVVLAAGVARWLAAAPDRIAPASPGPAPRRYAAIAPPPEFEEQMSAALDALPYRPADSVVGSAERLAGDGVRYGESGPILAGRYLFQAVCVGQGVLQFAVFQEEDPDQAAVDGARVVDTPVQCASVATPVIMPMSVSGEAIHVSVASAPETVGALVWQVVPG